MTRKPSKTAPAEDPVRAEWHRRARRVQLLAVHPDGEPRSAEERDKLIAAEVELCSRDIFHWLDNYACIGDPKAEDPAKRMIPFRAWPIQRDYVAWLLTGVDDARVRVLNKSREVGATWVALMVIYWLWRFRSRFFAHLASRNERAVDDLAPKSLFGKLSFLADTQPDFLKPAGFSLAKHRKKLHLANPENGSLVTGEGLANGFSRGDRVAVILTDEWAHVPRERQQGIRLGIESVARSWWKISTPNGRGDDFHAAWRMASEGDRMEIGWEDDPRKSPAWFENLLVDNGGTLTWDERAQEHGRSFVGVSSERIWRADRDAIVYRIGGDARVAEVDVVLPAARRRLLPVFGGMDFGSGPSLTVCVYALVEWEEGAALPILWVELCRVWQRRAAPEVGEEIVADLAERWPGSMAQILGDPSGVAADSSQSSWEQGLRSSGAPFQCLPADYNSQTSIDQTLRDVQRMIDAQRLRIHPDSASIVLETIESWQYDLPKGVPLELVSREQIRPRKDAWSHVGDALRYLVGAILRWGKPRAEGETMDRLFDQVPMTEGGAILEMYRRAGL